MRTSSFYKRWAILIVSFLLLLFIQDKVQGQTWYNASWLYRKAITIDYTKVSAGSHTNFPVLINITDADLQTRAQADFDDILFTSSDGTTKLAHEVESYTSGTGALVAWVEIPSLSSSANTVIYMYYGNAAATAQQNIAGTWDASFKGVWHMNTVFTDATSNANNGTNTGTTAVTGKISGGRGFVRSNGTDYITITGLMSSPTSFTLSAWATLTTADPNGAEIISIGDNTVLRYDENSANRTSGVIYNGGGVWSTTGSGINYAGTGWHYVVYTFDDAGNSQKLYVDGTQIATSSFTTTPVYTSGGTNTFIGKHGNGNVNMDFDGTIDEARVSNASRSAGWVLTEYNNQNSPSTFYSVGSEVNAPVTKTFTGTGNFSTAARWSGGTLPAAGDNLIIDGACTVDNSGTTDNVAYGTLIIGSTAARTLNWIASGTNRLNVTNVSSSFAASALNMTNGGTLIVRGTWTSANLTFTPGTGTIDVRSTMTLPAAYATYYNLIVNGSATTVSVGVNTTVNNNLTVTSGTFTVGAFSLAVTGITTVTGTLTITSTTGTKTFGNLTIDGTFNNTTANAPITINGNFQNNGVYNGGTARVTFTGASSNTVTGTAATTAFGGGITVNKGTANTNVLDVQSVITMSAGGLTLTNGTFKLSSASTITPFTANITGSPYLIPSTAGLWCNGGTMTASSMAWTVNGLIRVSAGTLNAGAGIGDYFAPHSATSIIVEGGNFNLADRLSLLGATWSFTMTNGTMTVAKFGSSTLDRPPFNMDMAASSFSMSGGTIIMANKGGTAGQNLGYKNLATSGTGFTGGTLQIGDVSTPAASIMGIISTNPIYNLTINSANATAQISTSALTVTNNVTITAGVLSANNLNLTVGGSWIQ